MMVNKINTGLDTRNLVAQRGFTLIELMITILIAAILMGVAVPSFESYIKRNTADSLQANISAAIATARTEAASRNKTVTICPTTDGLKCSNATATAAIGTAWSTGWLVYEGAHDTANNVAELALIDEYKNGSSHTFKSTQTHFSFNSQGFLIGLDPSGSVNVCAKDDTASTYARGVYVNTSGLVIKTRDTDPTGDGIHNDPQTGSNIVCP